MANARQCDRCGAFYTDYANHPEIDGSVRDAIRFCDTNNLAIDTVRFDFCSDCMNKIYNFIFDGGNKDHVE